MKVGVARTDITPTEPVWLTGYGDRHAKSTGHYAPLFAGAVFLAGDADAALILTADATGLLPRQVVLTATHTHCAPFFTPWCMPGQVEPGYAAFLEKRLVHVAIEAMYNAGPGQVEFSRGASTFGVNRRLPDGAGSVTMAPNPDGSIDRDLDTLWLHRDDAGLVGTLTVYGCHPTSLSGYRIGPDYPGLLCRHVEAETGVPALFATGCAGDVRPWYKREGESGFLRPDLEELDAAGAGIAAEVLATRGDARTVPGDALRIDHLFHSLPYLDRPTRAELDDVAAGDDPLAAMWASLQLQRLDAGALAEGCPHEIQVLQLSPDFRAVFLGGEILSEIGLHLKRVLAPATTMTVAYANGLIAYVPSANAWPLGGYEVHGSHRYFGRPAAFTADCEALIVQQTQALVDRLS
jgi:neutral ceramidase